MGDERCLGDILSSDMVVSGECIEETREQVSRSYINQLINGRKWVRILRTSIVEICVINTDYPLPVGFFDQNDMGQPFQILQRAYEISFKQLINHLIDSRLTLWSVVTVFLLGWFSIGINPQFVDNYRFIDS